MAGVSTSALDIGPSARAAPSLRSVIPDFLALTKPEVNFLIVIGTFTGFYLGYPGDLHNFPVLRMLSALFGTLLVASGTGTLNQYLEHRFDAQMRRTSRRPIAAGRIRPWTAAWFGLSLTIAGSVYLLATVNALSSALAVFTAATYLLIYTPIKTENAALHISGGCSGRHASADRLGGRGRFCHQRQSLDAIRRSVPLAISSLYGNRLDVS